MATLPRDRPRPAGPMVPAPFRVVDRRRETADTWTLELAPLDGRAATPFRPGQFTMVGAAGRGEVPISISGDPARPATLVHTVRAVGAATRAICNVPAGGALSVRGPFGSPWPVRKADGTDLVVVAGGIGLAPLRPAILQALSMRERLGRLVVLYGGRQPDQLLYTPAFDEWRRRGADVAVTVDAAGRGWRGGVGVVTKLIDAAPSLRPDAVALVCGPEAMMRFSVDALRARGLADDHIHLSMERNMQCGIGHCGHCQLGPTLVCRDGPVYRYDELAPWLSVREL